MEKRAKRARLEGLELRFVTGEKWRVDLVERIGCVGIELDGCDLLFDGF
jgi:hypothetical protein